MNHTCLCLLNRSWYSFADSGGPEGWKAELALGGWLVAYRNRCPAPGIEPGDGRPSNPVRRLLNSWIEANALTTTPDHQPRWFIYDCETDRSFVYAIAMGQLISYL